MLIKYSSRSLLLTSAMMACTIPGAAHAAAFYLQEQSVKAAGRAFSGEVADTGPESLWWNPAAIGGMTSGEAYIGAAAILPHGRVVDTGTAIVRPGQPAEPVGGDPVARNPIDNGVLPSGAVAYGLGRGLAFGLAVISPYSFTTDYDPNSWVRYTADRTRLRTFDIQPSIAIALGEAVRLGAAVNVEHASASLSNALPNLAAALPDGSQTLSGKSWDLGWSAGAQFQSGPVTLGASYKSSIRHTLDGQVVTAGLLGPLAAQNGTIGANASFRTPWQVNVGARVKLSPQLTLDGQATRFGWSKFDAIRLGAPLNVAIPENYRDTWAIGGGLDYDVTQSWTLRAGVQHDQTPTRNGERDARVPDSNRWNFALGTSYRLTHAITLDASASYIDFKNAPIDRTTAAYAGTPAQTPILVSGELQSAHALVFGLGARATF